MNLKILKLRSGEEIACQVLEENENKIKVFQPMLFKTTSTYDFMGRTIDVTTLQDWLSNTDDKNIDIPINHIVHIITPNKNTTKLYILESEKEFSADKKETVIEENKEPLMNNDLILSDMLEDLTNIMKTAEFNPPKKAKRKKKDKKLTLPPDMTDENELDRHMIMMQMYIPAESIMNLITAGIIEPKVLLDMIDEIKKRNRFTGDEKERKDFGNNFSDWNPDPNSNDY